MRTKPDKPTRLPPPPPDITQDERIRRTRANLALSSLRLLATRWVIQGGSAEELAKLCGLTKDELSDLTGRAW